MTNQNKSKSRPIIFSAEMVNAILENRKTMTRRVVNFDKEIVGTAMKGEKCPYGKIGDRLWVRETFGSQVRNDSVGGTGRFTVYKADNPNAIDYKSSTGMEFPVEWKSPIFIPRIFSRITLEITNISVKRLQDISEEDCIKEGIEKIGFGELINYNEFVMPGVRIKYYASEFMQLWQQIKGKDSWDQNPFVWVISFRRVENDK